MTLRSSAGRRRLAALLAVGALAVGALSGCSGRPGAAAIVDGRQISVAELQVATGDLGPIYQNVTQSSVLVVLIVAPVFDRAATESGVNVSPQQAVDSLNEAATAATKAGTAPARTTDFSPAAIEIARFLVIQANLQELDNAADVTASIADELAQLDPEINPRYGEADFTTGSITPIAYPWLVAPPAAQG